MTHRSHYIKLLIGIILLFIIGTIFTKPVKSQETAVFVTPLSTVSTYQLPKEPESNLNSLNSLQTQPSDNNDESTNENDIPVPLPESNIEFEKVCDPTNLSRGEETTCTVTVKNNSDEDFSYKILDFTSKRMTIQEDSVVGGDLHSDHLIMHRGNLAGGTLPTLSIENIDSSLAYNSLGELGIPPLTDVQDEAMINVATLEPYMFAGQEYTTVGIGSNGYLIPGLGSDEDIAYIPQIFPDPAIPNNVVAPFWTDLNPEAGGNIYAALLTRDNEAWVVIEWENVPAFDSEKPAPNCIENCDNQYTFQVWLKTNTTEQDITFIYAQVDGSGADSGLNIGVENNDGTIGTNYESVPTVDDELIIITTPGIEGESHVITYTAEANRNGHWYGGALMKLYNSRGIIFDCVYGTISD